MNRLLTALLLAIALPLQAATLKIATIAPDGTPWMAEMRKATDLIERRTEGRVNFRIYPGGVMGDDKSMLRKIRLGQLHGGVLVGGGASQIHPDAILYSLPFAFKSYDEVDYVRGKMDGDLIATLDREGFVCFGFTEAGFAYFLSQEPLKTIDDLRRHKVWVPEGDELNRMALESLDVSPISLPLTDVLTGLQTGLIDTVATSPIGAIALQWHTRVSYLADAPLVYVYATMVVDKRAFDRIAEKDRAVVREVMDELFKRLDRQNRIDNQGAREALKAQGIEFIETGPRPGEDWQAVADRTVERAIAEGLFPREGVARLRGHLEAYRRDHAGK